MFKCIMTGCNVWIGGTNPLQGLYTTDLFYDINTKEFGVNTLVKLNADHPIDVYLKCGNCVLDIDTSIVPKNVRELKSMGEVANFNIVKIDSFTAKALNYMRPWIDVSGPEFSLVTAEV